jgi:hypothetical protein
MKNLLHPPSKASQKTSRNKKQKYFITDVGMLPVQWDKIKFGIFPSYNQNPKVNKVWDFRWLQLKSKVEACRQDTFSTTDTFGEL